MTLSTVTLVCTFKTPGGNNASGTITAELTHELADTAGNQIAARIPVTGTLSSGTCSLSLWATDDATTQPQGVTYKITEAITGSRTRTYEIELPNTPATQYLADLAPATVSPAYTYILEPGSRTDGYVLTADSAEPSGTKWAAASGGGGGAPTTASYVTLGTNGTLSAERVLTAGANISITDGGANSTVTVAVTGAALTTNNLSDLGNAATARTNLGLGDSATKNVGTTAGTVAAGDHNHSGVYDPAGTAAGLVDDLSGVSNAATARTNLGLGTAAVVDTGTGATNAILGNDSRLADARTPTAHASSHAPGGSDALAWTTVHGYGLASARPAAAASNAGYVYLASDTGTLSRSNGSTWDDLLKAGTGATNYAAGNDSRLSDSRAPSGTAGGDLSGSYPNPSVVAASDTTAGKVELATAAETTTGTDATRAVTPDGLAGSEFGVEVVEIMASDMSTAITTGDGKAGFMVPAKLNGWNLIRAHAGLLGAQSTSGTPTVQIRRVRSGTPADMLSTRITIDINESTSYTAATAPVIDTSNDDVATGDLLYVDVDTAGTGAKGLIVSLGFQLP